MSRNEPQRTALEVCRHAGLSDAALELLTDRQRPQEFFAILAKQALYRDAIRVAAHVLPKREAVWWAVLCLWHQYRPQPAAPVDAVLRAALHWSRQPSDPHRRQAEAAALAAGLDQPAGLVGMAVFHSGGSIAPAGQPEVAPKPELTGQLIATALLLAIDLVPAQKSANEKLFATLAAQVGPSGLRWDYDWEPTSPVQQMKRPSS